jgi:hypothetical protein
MLLVWAMTDRYMGDFYPLVAVGTAFSLFWVTRYLDKGRVARLVVLGVGALFVVWSIVANLGLAFPLAPSYALSPTPVHCSCAGGRLD